MNLSGDGAELERRRAQIGRAFRESLRGSAVEIRDESELDPGVVVRLRVVVSRPDEHTVAMFEASGPEYVGLVLDNGAHFWENEWDSGMQSEFAGLYSELVAEHLRGGGTLGSSQSYEVIVNGEIVRSQGVLAASKLREVFAEPTQGNTGASGRPKRGPEAVAEVSDGGWFSGAVGRTDDEREFLGRLRGDAAGWGTDVQPANSVAFAWDFGPLVVGVEVPELTVTFRHLWVSYWSVEPGRRALEGAWGSESIADNYRADRDEDLTVSGVKAEPDEFATWCSRWLVSQLRRPVVREEWGPGERAVVWKLADTGHTLQTKGPWWRRRGEATTVERER